MINKKGAATLYIIVGLTVFLGIMTYIFSITSNLEIDILAYFNNIKTEYEKDMTEEQKIIILEKLQEDIDAIQIPERETEEVTETVDETTTVNETTEETE